MNVVTFLRQGNSNGRGAVRLGWLAVIALLAGLFLVAGPACSDVTVKYRLFGLNFSPYLDGQDPNQGSIIGSGQIEQRMRIVAPYTRWVRTFGSTHGLEEAGRIAHSLGLKAAVGAWLGPVKTAEQIAANEAEIGNLITQAQAGHADLVIVGSEALLRGDLNSAQVIDYLQRVKGALPDVRVTYADTYRTLLDHPEIIAAVDVVFFNHYGYWEGLDVKSTAAALHDSYQQLVAASGGKRVIVSESGWPSCGETRGEAIPSPENANFYFLNFVSWARANKVQYHYFAAFDESWKAQYEGPQGACWGLWNKNGKLKKGMRKVFNGRRMPDNWTVPGGPGEASLEFTSVPPIGSGDYLRGHAWHVKPADYKVAVYIRVRSGWWTKPYFNQPLTNLNADGSWQCDIVTGGIDAQANTIAAFLVPAGYSPLAADGDTTLPAQLDANAVAKVEVSR